LPPVDGDHKAPPPCCHAKKQPAAAPEAVGSLPVHATIRGRHHRDKPGADQYCTGQGKSAKLRPCNLCVLLSLPPCRRSASALMNRLGEVRSSSFSWHWSP
jgi:hypothetical protein